MHFRLILAIPTLPLSLNYYGVAQVYQRGRENCYGNCLIAPETT